MTLLQMNKKCSKIDNFDKKKENLIKSLKMSLLQVLWLTLIKNDTFLEASLKALVKTLLRLGIVGFTNNDRIEDDTLKKYHLLPFLCIKKVIVSLFLTILVTAIIDIS